jgi:transmembrane sensor
VKIGNVRFADINNNKNEVFIAAGQKASLVGKILDEGKITDNNFLSWQNGVLIFDNASLNIVIDDINHHYNAHITMSDSVAAKSNAIKVTYKFEKNSLSEVLEEIQLTTGLKATQKHNTVLLY